MYKVLKFNILQLHHPILTTLNPITHYVAKKFPRIIKLASHRHS